MKLEGIKDNYKKNGFELTLEAVLSFNDPELAYEFAKENNTDVRRLGKVVIDSKNAMYNFYYARDIEGADIKSHEDVVLEANNPHYSILFMAFIPNADIKKHSQIILKSKNPYLNYYCALLIAKRELDLSIKPHEKVVLQSKNPEWNFQFVTVPGANIVVHGNVIYKTGDKRWIDAFNDCFKDRYEEAKVKAKKRRAEKYDSSKL